MQLGRYLADLLVLKNSKIIVFKKSYCPLILRCFDHSIIKVLAVRDHSCFDHITPKNVAEKGSYQLKGLFLFRPHLVRPHYFH